MPDLTLIAALIGGLVIMAFAGDFLVNGAVAVARRLGVSPLIAGIFIVGFGTSAPEMVVSLNAALEDRAGLALGNIVGSNIANIFLVISGACVMVIIDPMDFQTGMSSVISAVMNVGPGFGDVGPSENYAHISTTGKWFLAWLMLIGRLEMFSALVLLFPSFWKR